MADDMAVEDPATGAAAGRLSDRPTPPASAPSFLSPDVGTRTHRTLRDWAMDALVFMVAMLCGLVVLLAAVTFTRVPLTPAEFYSDLAFGTASCLLLFLRRRWAVQVALIIAPATALSSFAVAPSLVAVFTVAAHLRPALAIAVTVVNAACGTVYYLVQPGMATDWLQITPGYALLLAALAWGMVARTRRQLMISLRDRAERSEANQRLLAEQARQAERTRLAREMHDVVAHRVSLIALHAGGLEIRTGLPDAEVQDTARLIRSCARQALVELGDVIGVLRDGPAAEEGPSAPATTAADIPELVEELRRVGTDVRLHFAIDRIDEAPGQLSGAAYRAVQESLTNVNKHAPGAPTTVSVVGAPGAGLRVSVRNELSGNATATPALPGSGTGLVGLAERVDLVGGTLSYGPTPDGEFVVDVDLAWPK